MDIVIVAQYLTDITKPGAEVSRFLYLAKMLNKNHEVEILTTDFIHSLKRNVAPVHMYDGVKIRMFHESGYPQNICLTRFKSHRELAGNIATYLDNRKKPDLVYCAVPSLDVGGVVARFCRRNKVRFAVDIQDLWPEAFKMVLNVPIISDLLFYPMKKKADAIYKTADYVFAVSDTYAKRAGQVNKKVKPNVVFLGTDKVKFDSYVHPQLSKTEPVEVVYVGSLEQSYDLESVIAAISLCHGAKLVVIGDGSRLKQLQQMAKSYKISCEFTGRLPYSDMVARMSQCDIAINPIRKGSAGSVINKVGDYAMAGLPVVNTQECEEYCNLLQKYQAGLNCRCEDVQDIANKLQRLIDNADERWNMARNSRSLGEAKFDRSKTYLKICEAIEDK